MATFFTGSGAVISEAQVAALAAAHEPAKCKR